MLGCGAATVRLFGDVRERVAVRDPFCRALYVKRSLSSVTILSARTAPWKDRDCSIAGKDRHELAAMPQAVIQVFPPDGFARRTPDNARHGPE
jgi:hypothetical protein